MENNICYAPKPISTHVISNVEKCEFEGNSAMNGDLDDKIEHMQHEMFILLFIENVGAPLPFQNVPIIYFV